MTKAFASDFDRTLYFKDGFHQDDILAISSWQRKGNLFGVCTGRSQGGVIKPTKGLIDYDFYILATGSLILDKDRNIIFEKKIPFSIVMEITKMYQDKYRIAYNCFDNFYSLYDDYEICITMKKIDELPKDIYGISIPTESVKVAEDICTYLNQKFPINAFNNGQFIDIAAKDCSKGNGIEMLKEKLKLDEISCMGDSFNDITMLEQGDISFTFNTSPSRVKEKANHVVSSLKEAIEYE